VSKATNKVINFPLGNTLGHETNSGQKQEAFTRRAMGDVNLS
jgi:hypothetical protein